MVPYEKLKWSGYDEGKTLEENLTAGAVATPERMEHMEEGIFKANQPYTAGTVEMVEAEAPAEVDITEEKVVNFKIPVTPGASAYDIAVANGFEGTVEEWLASLKGKSGIDGVDGAQGDKGDPGEAGVDGKDANVTSSAGTAIIAVADWVEAGTKFTAEVADESVTSTSGVMFNISGDDLAVDAVGIHSLARVAAGKFIIVSDAKPDTDINISYVVVTHIQDQA